MKAVMCLVVLALASAMASPVEVSEAKLAIQSNSDLLTYGNGLYHPVRVVNEVREVVVPVQEVVIDSGVREVLLQKGIRNVVVEIV